MPNPEGIIPFAVMYTVLFGGGWLFFLFNQNARLKRKLWPLYLVATGFAFGLGAYSIGFPAESLVVLIPFGVLVMLLNIRVLSFCNTCGGTVYNQSLISKAKFCSKCGAQIEHSNEESNGES